ncbi:hypothetical protein N657DRAFT_424360 [Parathielavia appendiculata]|uniref:Uncharacterized protein n=1 Tax=Parathielavia appendiculata TaxID=2587402 RepID=A0AAN6TZU2_9PEZI|nr:hypothetical protein N657DRAFT_424360 [Parathielavia appendiculata]
MTKHVQDELASLQTEGTTESSTPAQRKQLTGPGTCANQKPAGKKGRKEPVNSKPTHAGIRLPCPLRAAEPECYAKITKGCKDSTYDGMRGVNEYIWRYHSWALGVLSAGQLPPV